MSLDALSCCFAVIALQVTVPEVPSVRPGKLHSDHHGRSEGSVRDIVNLDPHNAFTFEGADAAPALLRLVQLDQFVQRHNRPMAC